MKKPKVFTIQTFNRAMKFVSCLIALTLFLPVARPVVNRNSGAPLPRIQSLLQQMAVKSPKQTVAVIVQKSEPSKQADDLVTLLGGKITRDLHIINGFVAEMSASAAVELANSDSVRWVSLDSPMVETAKGNPTPTPTPSPTYRLSTPNLKTVYNQEIGADKLWAEGYQGSGVTVAVVDSGVAIASPDLTKSSQRVLAMSIFAGGASTTNPDMFGHGTHIAGTIGGDGYSSNGGYIGVAPKVNLVSVKVSDDTGIATASSVVAGLQWVNDNAVKYNIRVVNLSLNATVTQSYNVDPIDAAVEILWFNKIVVVVSAGNNGSAALYPPANDPFVITVGAVDDKGTVSIGDDIVTNFSAYGTTADGFAKPDLVAPGNNIISINSGSYSVLAKAHPANIVETNYFRMSGTSTAAPIVSGAVALLLQDEPGLNPDQVKYRLKDTANKSWPGYNSAQAGAGMLDAYAAVKGTTTQTANTGTRLSNLLTTGPNGVQQSSVSWSSVSWSSVSWSSVSWSSVSWSSVSWSSDYWADGVSGASLAENEEDNRQTRLYLPVIVQ
ncbi:MAG: S8 family peptidase [Caldilineaceae bacterium]